MTQNQDSDIVKFQPEGRWGVDQVNAVVKTIRESRGSVEFDLTKLDVIEISMIQVLLVTTASLPRKGRTVVVKDSDSGLLRRTLHLAGIDPQEASLCASLTL